MDALIGRKLKGKFRITSQLGDGAMGTVFRGVDTTTGKDVAIKVMRPGLMKEPGMLTRFRREATAMRRVRHPNAVEVLAYGVDDGHVFLAMELVEGSDLAERFAKEGRFSANRAARILADVCSALAEAHALGLVHRDIKPENIMLGGPGGDTVKLIDFGIAKPTASLEAEPRLPDEDLFEDSIPASLNLQSGFDLTTAGTLVGSPGYMAPEQWATHAVDARTDVYACGVVLYLLVTGRMPFEAENPFQLASMQMKHRPAPPHILNPEIPEGLSHIILRALRPAPEDRFQSAADMRDALRTVTVESPLAATLALEATLPVQTSFRDHLGLSPSRWGSPLDIDSRPSQPALEPLDFDDDLDGDVSVPAPAVWSVARSSRRTPVPAPAHEIEARAALARVSTLPPVRAGLASAQLRALLPLAAAFLALGLALGILLFFPAL